MAVADFDAGSIEGRLDLDTDPFERGLQKARAEAEQFERRKITRTVDYDSSALPDSGAGDQTVKIDADDSGLRRALTEDELRLRRFSTKRYKANVDVDTDPALRALQSLDRHVNDIAGFYKRNSSPGLPGSGHGLAMLVGLAASLAPALGPATGAIALFGAAGIAAFGGAAVSLALYAKIAGGVLGQLQEAIKSGEQLPGLAGRAENALKGLEGAWSALQKAAAPGIFKTFIPIFNTLASVLPKLLPLINGISKGLSGAFEPLAHVLEGGQFEKFIALLSSNAIKDLPQLGQILASGFRGLMGLFTALNPIIQVMLPAVVSLTKQFAQWSRFKAPGFFNDLFDTVQKYGPQTIKMLGDLGTAAIHIGEGLAPLTGPALSFLSALAKGLASIDISSLARGVGSVLKSLRPFLKVIAELVNVLLPPLGVLLSTVADTLIGPLGKSLVATLNPALDALSSVLNTLAPVLGKVISSFADIANSTGVPILVEAITALAGPINTLLPPLGELIVALESMVDVGLESLEPAIAPLGATLGVIAEALVPVVTALTAILSNRAVVDILLAIAAAVKLWSVYQFILDAALTANPIGLIVVAIAALVVGIIAAYQHSEKFRAIVDAVWSVMKQWGNFIKAEFVVAWHLLSVAFDFVRHHLRLVLLLLGPLGVAINVVIEIVKHWSTITHVVTTAWGKVIDFFKAVPGKIKGWFSSAGQWLLNAGSAIIHGLWTGLNTYWRTVIGFYGSIGSKIKAWFTGAAGWLISSGSAVLHGLWDGLNSFWHTIASFYGSVHDKFQAFFAGAYGWLLSIGGDIIQGLWDGLSSKFNSLLGWAEGKINDLMGLFHKIPVIGSPSKVTTRVGLFIGQGLRNGLATSFDRLVLPTAKTKMKALMAALNGSAMVALEGSVSLSSGGVGSKIDTLADAVNASTARSADNSVALLTAIADLLGHMTDGKDKDALVEALAKAFDQASEKQTSRIITTLRTNR